MEKQFCDLCKKRKPKIESRYMVIGEKHAPSVYFTTGVFCSKCFDILSEKHKVDSSSKIKAKGWNDK